MLSHTRQQSEQHGVGKLAFHAWSDFVGGRVREIAECFNDIAAGIFRVFKNEVKDNM